MSNLNLYYNELSGNIPAELGSLSNLEYLNLSRNDVSGNIPTELGDLSNLKYLQLWGTLLSGSIPTELGSLSNLEFLDLSNNYQMDATIPVELHQLCDTYGNTLPYGSPHCIFNF